MGKRGKQAGGAAMQAGARYQNQVTGWLAAKMLAERPAEPIAHRGKLTYIAAESGEAVDDILVGADSGSYSFIQAERKISLSSREDSDLDRSSFLPDAEFIELSAVCRTGRA